MLEFLSSQKKCLSAPRRRFKPRFFLAGLDTPETPSASILGHARPLPGHSSGVGGMPKSGLAKIDRKRGRRRERRLAKKQPKIRWFLGLKGGVLYRGGLIGY